MARLPAPPRIRSYTSKEKPMADTTLAPAAPEPPLLAALIHDYAQKGLTAAAAALATHGLIAAGQEAQFIQLGVSAVLFAVSCAWTLLAARLRASRLEAAIAAPAVTPPSQGA
jgi:hypothetical protein